MSLLKKIKKVIKKAVDPVTKAVVDKAEDLLGLGHKNTNTITTPAGQADIDSTIVPFVRENEIEFSAINLKPNKHAYFFFDDVYVSDFVQRASVLQTDSANTVFDFAFGERLYCHATHALASVLEVSPTNTIYINENYLSINVNALGANTLGANDYSVGDIVFQAPIYRPTPEQATFSAKVAYWNNGDKVLVVEPLTGTLYSNNTIFPANVLSYLAKAGSNTIILAANVVNGAKFPISSQVISLDNAASTNKFLVSSYDHRMGVVSSTATPNTNCVIVSGTPPSDAVGNLITLTAQSGLGQRGTVMSVSGQTVFTNKTFSPVPTSNTYYSFGVPVVDNRGYLAGVFNVPETGTVKFLVGLRKFKITDTTIPDDPNASMLATGYYTVSGYIDSQGNSTPVLAVTPDASATSSPVVNPNPAVAQSSSVPLVLASDGLQPNTFSSTVSDASAADLTAFNASTQLESINPIAQTFYSPSPVSAQANYGIFVSSVDLWFSQKPTGDSPAFPITLSIVKVDNGLPTSIVVASATLHADLVNFAGIPDGQNIGDNIDINQTSTRFRFPDPVYLNASTEYALVLSSESPDYSVFVSEIGQNDITSNIPRRVSEQPNAGSFYRAQNSSVWTPYQNIDLMFVINKAVFETNPVTFTFDVIPEQSDVYMDSVFLQTSDTNYPSSSVTYRIKPTSANGTQDTAYTQLVPSSEYSFGKDLTVSSKNSSRRRVVSAGIPSSLQTQVTLQTDDPNVSPMFNSERLSLVSYTNVVGSGGIYSDMITITNGGNHSNASNLTVTISDPDDPNGTKANVFIPVLDTVTVPGTKIVPFVSVDFPGSGYYNNPVITILEPGATSNATAVVNTEAGKSGGNGFSRYISRKVTLADGFNSGDLRVFLKAIRPAGTDIEVYYKVISPTDSEVFNDKPWVLMSLVSDINSIDQSTSVQLQYAPNLNSSGLPSGSLSYIYNGQSYPIGGTFNQFQVKIVEYADDSTVIPIVQSMSVWTGPQG